ncbi:MAG: hypothetical protein AAB899_01835 [Patescibacteria group bacterium]
MKLFLIGLAHMVQEQVDVARALKKNHQIQYWVRMTNHFAIDEKKFPGTVFHEYLDALKGVPAHGIDANKYEPWSRKDILAYADIESEFMSMADKLYPDWPVNRRKELYYDMLRYWGGVLAQYAPDAIILLSVPHGMYDFVLYRIARRRGIRTLILDDTLMDTERFVVIEDYTKGNVLLATAAVSKSGLTLDKLSPEMREYYLTMTRSKNPSPPLMKTFFETHTPLHNLRRLLRVSIAFIKDGTIVERAVMKLFKLMKRNLLDEHRQYQREADFKKPYVYFPLQYQPELTTSPLGGVFVDQLLAVKIISAALPDGWELYVKEHPAQVGVHGGNETTGRWRGFYKTIAEIPRVRLVPINTNTFALGDNAKATATMTGTAAWESILRGKPALVFGYPWFQHAPGILRVESVEECRRAFEKIKSGFKPEESEIIRYLSVLDEVSHKGSLYYIKTQVTDWKIMHRAIEDALVSFSTQSR